MVRDAAARAHVQRVESFIDFVVLLREWKARVDRDIDLFIELALELSPDVKRAA